MSTMFEKVKEFHKKFGIPIPNNPTIVSNDVIDNRWRKTCEEIDELEEEFFQFRNGTEEGKKQALVRLAHETADVLYMILGNAVSFGIDIEKVFNEVHKSNMTKTMNLDGYIVKTGLDYKPADIEKVIYG